MTGNTHATIGVLCGLLIAPYLPDTPTPLLLAFASGVGALVPDIDNPSTASNHIGPLAWFSNRLPHRGPTHSILAIVALAVLSYLSHSPYPVAFTVGYASHIVADMVTSRGVKLLWPFQRDLHLMPPFLRLKTGGIIEKLIHLAVAVGIIGVLVMPLLA